MKDATNQKVLKSVLNESNYSVTQSNKKAN